MRGFVIPAKAGIKERIPTCVGVTSIGIMTQYKLPRGTHDFLPDEMVIRNYIEKVIREIFEVYGYQQIQTPTFEEFALLSARSGEEIRESMFTFFCDDTEYGLRPELTASICRLIAAGKLERFPKPYRLYYIAQCFRYERPQAGRYREFTQAGVELIGASSPLADVEVIAIVIRILDKLGITPYQLKIGNIGIFRSILDNENLDYNNQNIIIGNIDNIISIREKCELFKEKDTLEVDDHRYVKEKINDLYSLQEEIHYKGEYEIIPQKELSDKLIKEWLDKLPVVTEVTYKNVWKQRYNLTDEFVDSLIEISKIKGNKEEIIKIGDEKIKNKYAKESFNNLLEILEWLNVHGIKDYEIVLGLARGLDYYTGCVFEVDCPLLGAQKQLCGGGRYDKLISEFGGADIPAVGFALGFDRVVEALVKIKEFSFKKIDVFVAVTDESMRSKAIEVSELLRRVGKRVEMDIINRNLKEQLGYASSTDCDYSVIIGPDELKQNCVILRNMKTKTQEKIELDKLVDKIR